MDARRDLEKKANGPISSYWFTLDEGNENEPLLVLDSDVELDEAEERRRAEAKEGLRLTPERQGRDAAQEPMKVKMRVWTSLRRACRARQTLLGENSNLYSQTTEAMV